MRKEELIFVAMICFFIESGLKISASWENVRIDRRRKTNKSVLVIAKNMDFEKECRKHLHKGKKYRFYGNSVTQFSF